MDKAVNVVILGGCGFLGQHIVAELLNERKKTTEDHLGNNDEEQLLIGNIKVLDAKPFSEDCLTAQRDDINDVEYQVCDIRDVNNLIEKLKGSSAVINCAALTPDFLKEDLGCGEQMLQVNVDGTKNVVRACQKVGIKALVHTSSVSVKMGGQRLIEHTEALTPEVSEEELVLGDYARGRLKAEQMVLEAHGTTCENGDMLKTVALRPPLMYGEGDTNFVPAIYSLAKAYGNRFPSIGNPAAFTQAAYSGNVAVAHICALRHLLSNANKCSLQTCGGLPVYITDDSPPNNIIDLTTPFLTHLDLGPSAKDSYWSTSLHLLWTDLAASIKSMIGFNTTDAKAAHLPSWPLHRFTGTITVVSRMRAELCLGYTPVYSWEEALKRSQFYYSGHLSE